MIIIPVGSVAASDPTNACPGSPAADLACNGVFPEWVSVTDSLGNSYTQLAGPAINYQGGSIQCSSPVSDLGSGNVVVVVLLLPAWYASRLHDYGYVEHRFWIGTMYRHW